MQNKEVPVFDDILAEIYKLLNRAYNLACLKNTRKAETIRSVGDLSPRQFGLSAERFREYTFHRSARFADELFKKIKLAGNSTLNRLNTNIEGTITTRRRLFMSAKKAHSLRKEVYRKRLVQMQLCRRSLLIAVSLNQLRWLS